MTLFEIASLPSTDCGSREIYQDARPPDVFEHVGDTGRRPGCLATLPCTFLAVSVLPRMGRHHRVWLACNPDILPDVAAMPGVSCRGS